MDTIIPHFQRNDELGIGPYGESRVICCKDDLSPVVLVLYSFLFPQDLKHLSPARWVLDVILRLIDHKDPVLQSEKKKEDGCRHLARR